MKKYFGLLISMNLLFCFSIFSQQKYEFRGVWVTTVNNSDWPSARNLSTEAQKAEFRSLLEMHKKNGLNALVVQIRPKSDAFYPSQLEPWSEYITGVQGKPPLPYYDPLEFMITETHNQGMEFHAWINPFRGNDIKQQFVPPTHISNLHPDWFISYGSKRYFDPGNREAREFVISVVRDIVSRYKVDAIHFDDYFYPYRNDTISFDDYYFPGVRTSGIYDFDDSKSFSMYGGGMDIESWRRSNIDSFIYTLSKVIKRENKFCKFGISPFPVWRNKDMDAEGSDTHAGHTSFDDLYADVLLWLKKGWIDYVAPQLYWEIGNEVVAYEKLVDWWAKNSCGKQVYIGMGIYRATEPRSDVWRNTNELPDQIKKLREYPQINGSIYFTSKSFNTNPNGWTDSLIHNYYKYPAIPPPMKWIDSVKPEAPELLLANKSSEYAFKNSVEFYIRPKVTNDRIKQFIIYRFIDPDKIDISNPINIKDVIISGNGFYSLDLNKIDRNQDKFVIGVTSLSNTNMESNISQYIMFERWGNGWKATSP